MSDHSATHLDPDADPTDALLLRVDPSTDFTAPTEHASAQPFASPAGAHRSVGLIEKSTQPQSEPPRLTSTRPTGLNPAGITTQGESL
jgi:hypothetical protein